MNYDFRKIAEKWKKHWEEKDVYLTKIDKSRPKYYVLSMFPYPSGAGLHVGHPLGYIAADIVARYKRLKGFNVLHPMGFDAFGLPAEQYAIQTGRPPQETTQRNINQYRAQLKKLGLSYDWTKEVQTCEPRYYKWTQWIFIKLFNSWYNKTTDRAEDIETLKAHLVKHGSSQLKAHASADAKTLSAEEWKAMSRHEQEEELLKYRLAYKTEALVNWCPALKTVLANDEIKNGRSERGGFPVTTKKMPQWLLRITAYADRLLEDLDLLSWPPSIKEIQRNWIGKSTGVTLQFDTEQDLRLEVFTTRIDTLFGSTFVVIAPDHPLVDKLLTEEQAAKVSQYIDQAREKGVGENQSEEEPTGVFTGSYAITPFSKKRVPIWIGDYVIASYGCGAVMGVPSGDERDYRFAKKFGLEIIPILDSQDISEHADPTKKGRYVNSEFLNGLEYGEAVALLTDRITKAQLGTISTNYRLRDAIFTRQRYWGEPTPIYYEDGLPQTLKAEELPLELPDVDNYNPTEEGRAPLARLTKWRNSKGNEYETTTMPGWAGSSWYWYRYMDPENDTDFAAPQCIEYWKDVDLYVGGAEHATGHLIYARFINKFLYDLGLVPKREPFKKLINQGMIQGVSSFVYKIIETDTYVSHGLKDGYKVQKLHVDIDLVHNGILDIEAFMASNKRYSQAEFILEEGKYICGQEVEKMSKSKFNVVNPDALIEAYGADTLRLYEMFLGPLEQSKPWDTNGILGTHNFIKKFYQLFFSEGKVRISDQAPSSEELKILHRLIKKVEDDLERYTFNTTISAFMITVNQLRSLKCNKRAILEPLIILLAPYAPFVCEELWELVGQKSGSLTSARFPALNESYLEEDEYLYPVSVNGKLKTKLNLPLALSEEQIKATVCEDSAIKAMLGPEKNVKKIIVVKGKIINLVV